VRRLARPSPRPRQLPGTGGTRRSRCWPARAERATWGSAAPDTRTPAPPHTARAAAPDVDEQEAVYRDLAQALDGRPLTLRTLDVGGDKPLRYLPVPSEDNPFLGVRGIRLSLARPGLLGDQLLAIVRVARDTPIRVMFPMIGTLAELIAARQVLDAAIAREGRGHPPGLQVGMMVEVPAAALKTAAFAPHVDFLSIGTNDLTQYALAAARGNAAVAGLADPYDPGVLRLVAAVCAGAGQAAVAVCGEFAADEQATQLLVGLGVGELSVAHRVVPAVKQAVRALNRGHAATTAGLALDANSPQQVRTLVAGRPAPQLVHPTRTAPPGDRHCCPKRAGPPQDLHRGDTPPEWRSARTLSRQR